MVKLYVLIISLGALGGIGFGFFNHYSLKLKMPGSSRKISLGFIGDAFIGSISSIAVFMSSSLLFNLELNDITYKTISDMQLLRLSGLCIVAGFAGLNLMLALVKKMTKNSSKLAFYEFKDQISLLIRHGNFFIDKENDKAETYYQTAMNIDNTNEESIIGYARILRRKNTKNDFKCAINQLDRVININNKNERAFYNRACYKNISNSGPIDEVLSDLEKAIALFDSYKSYAKDDSDFDSIRDNKQFIDLTNG